MDTCYVNLAYIEPTLMELFIRARYVIYNKFIIHTFHQRLLEIYSLILRDYNRRLYYNFIIVTQVEVVIIIITTI